METKFATKYLTTLINDFSLVQNKEDKDIKYLKSRNQTFFCLKPKQGFVIVDSGLCHTLKASYGIENKTSIITLLNIFFKEVCITIDVSDIYILDFKMFNE